MSVTSLIRMKACPRLKRSALEFGNALSDAALGDCRFPTQNCQIWSGEWSPGSADFVLIQSRHAFRPSLGWRGAVVWRRRMQPSSHCGRPPPGERAFATPSG